MLRKFINIITAITFVSCMSSVSFAQDNRFAPGAPLVNKGQMQVGLYMKIPFTGGLKAYNKEKLKFGAALGITQNYRAGNYMFAPQKQLTANFVDLKFDSSGFNALSLSGQNILVPQNGDIVFATDKDGKVNWGKVGLISLAVVGGVAILAVAAIAACQSEGSQYESCIGS